MRNKNPQLVTFNSYPWCKVVKILLKKSIYSGIDIGIYRTKKRLTEQKKSLVAGLVKEASFDTILRYVRFDTSALRISTGSEVDW
jgi:hypothetical protein